MLSRKMSLRCQLPFYVDVNFLKKKTPIYTRKISAYSSPRAHVYISYRNSGYDPYVKHCYLSTSDLWKENAM